MEHGDKASLNTPGGDALLKKLGGSSSIPYYAFLTVDGEEIVNSTEPGKDGKKGENIGFPTEPHEFEWFAGMCAKAAPTKTPEERATIEKVLRAKQPAPAEKK